MTDKAATFTCPIDGAELKDGQPCKVHGVAYSEAGLTAQNGRTVAVAGPLSGASQPDGAAPRRRRRKAATK